MDDPQWVKKFQAAERPGLYCRVIKTGIVKAGDEVTLEKYTGETISILQMYRDHFVKDLSEESLRLHLNAPIDIRNRKSLERKLEKISA